MKNALYRVLIVLVSVFVLMYAEYRYIMLNLCPYDAGNGTVFIEIFNRVDEYNIAPVSELE